MKKHFCVLLCLIITLSITGCSKEKPPEDSSTNEIHLAELDENETNIIELLGVQSDIDIFEYQIDDTFKTISIWIEFYKDGELQGEMNRMHSRLNSNEGLVAIVVDREANYQWKISHKDGNGVFSFSTKTENEFETNGKFSVGRGALNQPEGIMAEKEIVMGTFLFEDGNGMSIYGNQHYVDEPDVLKDYDYVYLVKCQFSKKTPNN